MEQETEQSKTKFRMHLKLSLKEWRRKMDQSKKKRCKEFQTNKVTELFEQVKLNQLPSEKLIK